MVFKFFSVNALLLFLSACSTIECASNKPNIVLITANDIGYMDVQEYAHHITGEKKRKMFYETPNLDRLCLEGISFENAYGGRMYSDSHAGLLTGRINADFDQKGTKREPVSIAGVLPDYHSAFIGKWHAAGTPAAMGFDQSGLQRGSRSAQADELTEQAVRYIESRSRIRNKPFFLCISHHVAEGSDYVKARDLAYFSRKRTRGWNGQSDPRDAAIVKGVDDSVGRILHKLWRVGLDENTVVIFMPANGCADAGSRKTSISGRGVAKNTGRISQADVGMRVPLVIRWKKLVKAGSWSNVPVDYADILPTVMQCAGYFPESLSADARVDGCSLSGLFWDTRNKDDSYERDIPVVSRLTSL